MEEFSMNQFLHLLETLETHANQIRADLGADWPAFAAEVQSLTPAFEAARDETALARAVGDLYMVCRAREPVMTVLRQTADTSGTGHDRRPQAGGTGYAEEMLIPTVVNRFHSLVAQLARVESSKKESKSRPNRNTPDTGRTVDH
jgi:hypothetical protein